MRFNKSLFCVLISLASSVQCLAQMDTMDLNGRWQFRERDGATWHPAHVPGEVFNDLLINKQIPDPFFRDNELKVQWVERMDWEYRTSFLIPEKIASQKNVDLVFDGLDTYADVYLNGERVLTSDNMFRQWRMGVKSKLKKGRNELVVYFHSAQNKVDSLAKSDLPYVIPDEPRAYVRKAQFHFGWDWGPKLTGCGIWKDVRLEAYNSLPSAQPFQPPVSVELVQKKDSIGESFYFVIDGKTVYMKGANYIPSDAIVSRVARDDYRNLLLMAKDANMNMLRIWGGGIYEDEYFYDLCDSLGIYVWQDFMFAGAMVPGDDHFFENVREEVKYQVGRLRHHKSIVLWCGNNEIDEAYHNWGWQNQFRILPENWEKLWFDYQRLFRDSIPKWINEVDSSRPYVSTSPRYGWGRPQSFTEGDSHYWGVWWGGEGFEIFESKTGRFVSEYGMQAMPNYSSVLRFTEPQDRYLYSKSLQNHQKAGNGFQKLNGYLQKYMIDSATIDELPVEDYVYLTQCVQYYGFKNMILIHRSKEPYNMGTLLWQFNDCWPVASWSITDYYNRSPKAAWYAVREAYRDDIRIARDSVRPKDLKLEDPKITWRMQGDTMTLKSLAFAKYVYVDVPDLAGRLSDNYFDLTPGIEKKIAIEGGTFKNKKVRVKSLFDVTGR